MKTNEYKIDDSIKGWFRLLRTVDSMFQDWECVGWFRSHADAESAKQRPALKLQGRMIHCGETEP